MPSTLQYRPTLIDTLITTERINSYKRVFNTTNDVELVGVYLWNTYVSSVIYPLISTAEITLRNSIDAALVEKVGTFWWAANKLKYLSFVPGNTPPHSVKSIQTNLANAYSRALSDKRKRYQISGKVSLKHSDIIAKCEFSTWEFILDNEFMGNNLIWPSKLGTVFKGPWTNTHANIFLSNTKDLVGVVREFRNRLFHNEPIWKKYGIGTEARALTYLNESVAKILSLIELVNPEKVRLLEKNGFVKSAYRACTAQEITRFKHLAQRHEINSIQDLTTIVNLCNANNEIHQANMSQQNQYKFFIYPEY